MKRCFVIILTGICILATIAGCSGSPQVGPGEIGRGNFLLSVNWDDAKMKNKDVKLLPDGAATITVSIDGERMEAPLETSVSYPQTTVTIEDLPPGYKVATLKALNSSSVILAQRKESFLIESGKTTRSDNIPLGIAVVKSGINAVFEPSTMALKYNDVLYFQNWMGDADATISGFFNNSNMTLSRVLTNGSQSIFDTNGGYDHIQVKDDEDLLVNGSQAFSIRTPKYIYVLNYNNSTISYISVIDSSNNSPVKTINCGQYLNHGILSHDGSRLYAVNHVSNSVSVIDTSTNNVISTIALTPGTTPRACFAALSPTGDKLYVSQYYHNLVTVINTETNSIISTVSATNPQDIYVAQNGTGYIACTTTNTVRVFDTSNDSLTGTISGFDNNPLAFVANSDESKLYVSNSNGNTVQVINTADNSLGGRITVGSAPFSGCLSADGGKVYIPHCLATGSVSVIASNSDTLIKTIPVGAYPKGVSCGADGRFLYVANSGGTSVSVIDSKTDTVVDSINGMVQPMYVVVKNR